MLKEIQTMNYMLPHNDEEQNIMISVDMDVESTLLNGHLNATPDINIRDCEDLMTNNMVECRTMQIVQQRMIERECNIIEDILYLHDLQEEKMKVAQVIPKKEDAQHFGGLINCLKRKNKM